MATDDPKFDPSAYRMHHQFSAVLATYAAVRLANNMRVPSSSLHELSLCMARILGKGGKLNYLRMEDLTDATAIETYDAIDYQGFDRDDGEHVIKLLGEAGDAIRRAQHADLAG